jgi:hypothetical protein
MGIFRVRIKLQNLEVTESRKQPSSELMITSRQLEGGYKALVGKPEGSRPLGRPRHRWEDNIKMDLREVGWGDADWIDLAQDRDRWRAVVYTVMNLRVP